MTTEALAQVGTETCRPFACCVRQDSPGHLRASEEYSRISWPDPAVNVGRALVTVPISFGKTACRRAAALRSTASLQLSLRSKRWRRLRLLTMLAASLPLAFQAQDPLPGTRPLAMEGDL